MAGRTIMEEDMTAGEEAAAELVAALAMEPFPVEPDGEAVAAARRHVEALWQERLAERGLPAVAGDLAGACKFASLFAAAAFGGRMEGGELHQYAVVDGRVVDLCEGASDMVALGDSAHVHDREFFGNPDHLDSLESCMPRVERWLKAFAVSLGGRPDPGAAP